MNHFIVYNISNMVCALTFGYFGSAVLGRRTGKLLFYFVTVVIVGFAIPFPTNYMPEWSTVLVAIPMMIAYFFLMFKGSVKNKILALILSFVLQNLSAMIPFYIVPLLGIENEVVASLIYECMFFSLCMALFYLTAKIWDSISLVMSSPKFMTFFLLPLSQFAMTFLVVYFISHNPTSGVELSLQIATDRIAIILFIAVMIMSLAADGMFLSGFAKMATGIREREQLDALKTENELTYGYIKKMESDIDGMNRYRHDMLNLMTTLRLTLECEGDSGKREALELLGQLTQKINGLKGSQFCPCMIVNCVLSYEEALMKAENITCDFAAEVPETLFVNELDLCRLMLNVLDNARESCCRCEEGQRFVYFNMRVADGYLYVVCRNTKQEGQVTFETTKKDRKNHGHGMDIIREIVDSSEGELLIDDRGDKLEMTAVLAWKEK